MDNILGRKSCICDDAVLLENRPLLEKLLYNMMLVRKFEEKILDLLKAGLVYGTAHLGIGEEATSIGSTAALTDEDYMLATHRGHGQIIGKGCDPKLVMAEILAKKTGLCGGKGGSMHVADFDRHILGANGILGANAPLACGAALAAKKKGEKCVAVSFFGDGASNQGAVHEAMNMASAWGLPVIFCLINNQYAMSTPLHRAVGEIRLAKRAAGYGMKAFECDGNDVLQVYKTMCTAREYALKNQKPVLVVEQTYRTSGHSKSDKNLYRSEAEIAQWHAVNPVFRYSNFLCENGLFTLEEVDEIDRMTTANINECVEYAINAPEPEPEAALENVYA